MAQGSLDADLVLLRLREAQARVAWVLLGAAVVGVPVWWWRAVEPFVRLASPPATAVLIATAVLYGRRRITPPRVGQLLFAVLAVLLIGAFTTGLLGEAGGFRDFGATAYAAVRMQAILVGGAYVAFGPKVARRWTGLLLGLWLYATITVLRLDGPDELRDAFPTIIEILLSTGVVVLLFDIATTTARQLAMGEREQRHRARLAFLDPLTGLPNRRGLQPAMRRAAHEPDRGAVIILDIDHFKSFNDTYGHDTGDAVLQGVADAMRHVVRGTDRLGRWGGEEFVIVLPDGGEKGALLLAERCRQAVRGVTAPRPVSASFGVAVAVADDEPEALLRRADECLYRAKDAGRDCVVAAWAPDVVRRDDEAA